MRIRVCLGPGAGTTCVRVKIVKPGSYALYICSVFCVLCCSCGLWSCGWVRVQVRVRVRVLVLVLVVRVVVQVYVVGKGGMGGVMVSVWGILPSRQRSTRVIVLP